LLAEDSAAIIKPVRVLNMKESYHLPYSGQIIGEIFKAFQATYPTHIKKDVQRYFRGERINDETKKEIFFALTETMFENGLFPYPKIFEEAFVCKWGAKNMLVRGLSEYTREWDALCSKLRYWQIPKSKKDPLLVGCFRLATIDLALRMAAFRHLSKLSPPDQALPLWAKRDGNTLFLKTLKERCNEWPSNDDLLKDTGLLNAKTKDNWFYRGRRPTIQNIDVLAAAFSKRIPGADAQKLSAELKRHYVLHDICHSIASRIGWDRVLELVGALYHQTARIQTFFAKDPKPIEEYCTRYVLHLFNGALKSRQAPWLKYLWDTEKDREWKKDIIFIENDWASRLIQANFRFVGESVLDRGSEWASWFNPLQDKITPIATHFSASAIDPVIKDEFLYWEKGEFNETPVERLFEKTLRRQASNHPESAKEHLDLAIVLGSNRWDSERLEEGYRECLKAIELRPSWDLPRIEAAIMFMRCEQYEQALQILEEATTILPAMTFRLAYATGFMLMLQKRFAEALEKFELAITLKNDHALAFDNAAFCAFHSGFVGKGKKLARCARQFGISDTYDLYDVGGRNKRFKEKGIEPLCRTIPCPERNCEHRN
jgi:tetratricopeptide (TPR) repeat protein